MNEIAPFIFNRLYVAHTLFPDPHTRCPYVYVYVCVYVYVYVCVYVCVYYNPRVFCGYYDRSVWSNSWNIRRMR